MDPREAMKKRMEARRAVQEFFESRRKMLKVGPFWDFSAENRFKRDFLARMNAIARDLEHKAMKMADEGREWTSVLEEAKEKLEKLKEEFLKELGEGTPWEGKFASLRELIKSL